MSKIYTIYQGDKYYKFGEGVRVAELTDDDRIIDVDYSSDITEWANWSDVEYYEDYTTEDVKEAFALAQKLNEKNE